MKINDMLHELQDIRKSYKIASSKQEALNIYNFLKKMGLSGSKRLPVIQEDIHDYFYYGYGANARGDEKGRKQRRKLLEKNLGKFSRRGIFDDFIGFRGLSEDELKGMFNGLSSIIPDKVQVNFTLGLDEVTIK